MTFEPIWGSLIACYLFLAGLGGGAFVTSAFLKWRCPKAAGMIRAGRVIAPVVVAVGLVLLMFDATAGFKHPLRFLLLLSNFGSVMTWGVVFLGAFEIVALVVLALDLKGKRVPVALDIAGAALGVCVAVYTGCLLGVCKTFPLWNNALLPVLFLVSATSTGMASVLLAGAFRFPGELNQVDALKKVHFWLPVIETVLVAALLFITANDASPAGYESAMKLVAGDLAPTFWLLFVCAGLVVPTVLEACLRLSAPQSLKESRRAHMMSATGEICILVGGFALRLLVLWAALPISVV